MLREVFSEGKICLIEMEILPVSEEGFFEMHKSPKNEEGMSTMPLI